MCQIQLWLESSFSVLYFIIFYFQQLKIYFFTFIAIFDSNKSKHGMLFYFNFENVKHYYFPYFKSEQDVIQRLATAQRFINHADHLLQHVNEVFIIISLAYIKVSKIE